jgi:hypothetical protein
MRYSSYSLLTSALDVSEWSASRPGRALPQGKRTGGTHFIRRWVGLRPGPDSEARGENHLSLPESNRGRPACMRHYTD